eukprot:1087692-Pyramimonas_sp.AAC.1
MLEVHLVRLLEGAARVHRERRWILVAWRARAGEALDAGPRPAHLAFVARPPEGPGVAPAVHGRLGMRAYGLLGLLGAHAVCLQPLAHRESLPAGNPQNSKERSLVA